MTKVILLFLVMNLISRNSISGQSKYPRVDFREIKKNIKSKKKTTYYPLLCNRYKNNDSSLTIDDYKHLYYGTYFQKKFSWRTEHRGNEIFRLMKKDDLTKAAIYCDSMLNILPISIQLIRLKIDILSKQNVDKNEIDPYKLKLKMLLTAIGLSGNGRSKETAFLVLYIADEYEYLYNVIGMKKIQTQFYEMPFDYLCFKKIDDNQDCLYFLPLK
jgi:hypothetical protein